MGDREVMEAAVVVVVTVAGIELERFIQADANKSAEERWYLQRKEPLCVVGEHRHWPFATPCGDTVCSWLSLFTLIVIILIVLLFILLPSDLISIYTTRTC